MATLSIDAQMRTLALRLDDEAVKPTTQLKAEVVGYVRQYHTHASAEALDNVLGAIQRKFKLNADAILVAPERGDRDEPFLSPVLPTTGFLGEYLQYTLGHEAPDLFHFWVGVSILQSAVRRNIYFEHGYYRIYPNSYIILVAPPGACKKTTAANIGVDILREVRGINVSTDKATPEALVKTMGETTQAQVTEGEGSGINVTTVSAALIFASELPVFLGKEKYNEGLITLLTTLYDCPTLWESTTVGRGRSTLRNVHLGLLGCVTPEGIARSIPEAAMGGGLISRTIFVVKETSPRCFAFPEPRDTLMRERLIAILQRLSDFRSPCIQSAAGLKWCEDWYRKHHKTMGQTDIYLSGYYERKQSHLIKLAMTLLISDGAQEMVITPEVYQRALAILNLTEKTMPLAMEKVQSNEMGMMHELVMKVINKHKGSIKHSELLRKVYGRMDATRLKMVINTLTEAGMLNEETGKGGRYYKLVDRRGEDVEGGEI